MAVKLNSTGGGSVTLDSPSTASNYTVTLPSAAGTLATTTGTGSVFTNPTINGFTGDTSAITIGATQFVKDASGNIGIGTASPSYKLDITGATYSRLTTATYSDGGFINARTTASGGTYNTFDFVEGTTTTAYLRNYGSVFGGSKNNYLRLWNTQNAPISFGTNNAETMTLDASGNLGLGVTPSTSWGAGTAFQLSLSGFQSIQNSTYIWQNAVYDGTNTRNLQNAPYALLYEQNKSLGTHVWYTATANVTAGSIITNTPRMTLDASGNLTVGYISTVSSGVINSYVNVNHITGSATSSSFVNFQYNGSQIGNVSQNGTTGVLYNVTSDQRLKENIVDAPNALSSINAIKVRSFDWISSKEHQEYGYIAQELLEVAPEAVHVPTDPEEMMGVDFGKLTPRLVKAIQELSAQNNALEARLAKLEAK